MTTPEKEPETDEPKKPDETAPDAEEPTEADPEIEKAVQSAGPTAAGFVPEPGQKLPYIGE